MKPTLLGTAIATALATGLMMRPSGPAFAADVIPVTEDVMTSSFFQGANTVRGYAGEGNRPVLRVSSDNPFGSPGAETIYLAFDHDFAGYAGPVRATLTLQSTSGGFGADAGPGNPFLVSAHAVDANPLTSIVDDTNPGGTTDWLSFFDDHVLAADAAARTSIAGVGSVSFDVSAIVNDWIAGSNAYRFIALTGSNDPSGGDFLHGFLNDNDGGLSLGHTYLTVAAVPEPEAWAMLVAGLGVLGARLRHNQRRG